MAWITRIWAKYQNKRYSLSSNLSPFESKTATQHQQQHSLLSSLSFTSIWLFSSASQSYKPVSSPNLSFFTLNGNTMLLHLQTPELFSYSIHQSINYAPTQHNSLCITLFIHFYEKCTRCKQTGPNHSIIFVTQSGHTFHFHFESHCRHTGILWWVKSQSSCGRI